ncbi:MAG: PepSY domain-containing protein [Clostridiales bacterium]|nr:PepSY domain-containing protein [Clostridiales bacterium]
MMKDHELMQKIRTATEHAAPDQLDSILSSCHEQKGEIVTMTKKKHKKYWFAGVAAAAALVLCVGIASFVGNSDTAAASTVVMLDVNPSLSLSIDEEETVLEVETLNEDAKEILGDMDLEGTSLEVAVNALIGSMLQNGYLGDDQNSVLVSVESEDESRGNELETEVSEAITTAMQSEAVDASVLSQTISTSDDELDALAESYGISLGKAALIQEVIEQDDTLSFEDLAALNIHEIALIIASRDIQSDSMTSTGTASEGAYIGSAAALNTALSDAGISESDVIELTIRFDSDNGAIVYEVEFKTDTTEYEYHISAVSGEIVSTSTGNNDSAESEVIDTIEGSVSVSDSYIGKSAAINAALADAGCDKSETTYINCWLEYDDGSPQYYEVEFKVSKTTYHYEIDLYDGSVLTGESESSSGHDHSDSDHDHSDSDTDSTSSNTYIGESAALSTALSDAGVSSSDLVKSEVKLDEHHDQMIYEVEFKTKSRKYEYEIDAVTGSVLSSESDD